MKIPKITKELKDGVKTYLLAKAYLETIRPTIVEYQTKILTEKQYPVADEHKKRPTGKKKVITKPFHTYLISVDDFQEYLQLLHEQHLAHGFDVKFGYCPLSMAEHDVTKAEWLIMDNAQYITEIDGREIYNMEKRQKYIDLTVNLVVNICDINTNDILEKVK